MPKSEMYILVVGSRSITDYSFIKSYLDNLIHENYPDADIFIVSGGAIGVDTFAERYADENGYKKVIMPAEWDKYGKSAGYRRNTRMHEFIASKPARMVVAFWNGRSKGTAHSFQLAEKYHNELKIVKIGGENAGKD